MMKSLVIMVPIVSLIKMNQCNLCESVSYIEGSYTSYLKRSRHLFSSTIMYRVKLL